MARRGRKIVLRMGNAEGIVPWGMCHRQEIPTGCSEISREQLTSARSTDINPARVLQPRERADDVASVRSRARHRPVFVAAYTRVHPRSAPWRGDLHSVRYASKRSNAVASRTHAQCRLMSQLLMNLPTMTRDHRHNGLSDRFPARSKPATRPHAVALLLV